VAFSKPSVVNVPWVLQHPSFEDEDDDDEDDYRRVERIVGPGVASI
jgi:hypothetical protein